jgi:hypothetical protein
MSQSTNPNESSTLAVSQTSTPSPVSSGAIPDLLKIGAIDTDTEMNVVTDVLEPVVSNSRFIRFAFQNKGILHSMSKINFSVTSPATESIFPLNIGIYSLIQRVTLKIGAKTICEIDDFNHFMGYKSMFVGNEAMKEREQYLTSRIMNFGFEYWSNSEDVALKYQWGVRNTGQGGAPNTNTTTAGNHVTANGLAKWINLDNGYDSIITTGSANGAPEAGGTTGRCFPNKAGTGSASTLTGKPIYECGYWQNLRKNATHGHAVPHFQVSIADLCPFLRVNQLPLYMMKELVELELQLSGTRDRAFCPTSSDVELNIDNTKTQMIADYIYYPQDMMVAYQNANPNLTFTYVDYRLSKFSVAASGAQMSTNMTIRNVGGAGRIITRVFFGVQNQTRTQVALFSKYNAVAPARKYDGALTEAAAGDNYQGEVTLNLKYNDNFLFPIDVKNSARHFHNTAEAEGLVPFTTRECYSRQGATLTDGEFRVAGNLETWAGNPGVAIDTNLSGQQFWCAMKLNDNTRINSRGIELYYQTSGSGDGDAGPINFPRGALQRVWLETIRQVKLEDGYVAVSYA